MNDMKKGEKGFKEKTSDKRKHKCIVLYDPDHRWFNLARKTVDKNSHVLYPDEQRVSDFLKLCIRHGDACIEAINKQRFAFDKRKMTIEAKKAKAEQALRDMGEL